MKHTVLPLLLALAVSPAFGKAKEQTYPASCDRVWAAVKKAANPPHYNYAQLDDAQKKGIISTGNTFSGKRYLDIALTGSGDTCTVSIGGNFSGLAHNDKGDLFKRIEEELALGATEPKAPEAAQVPHAPVQPPSSPVAAQSISQAQPKETVKDNAEMEKGVGTVSVSSVPDGAEVYVDGALVGGVPATLRLTPGKHTIRVALSGYKDWNRELSVLEYSNVRLTATLEK
jgi:hypothetical protein